VGAIPNGRVLTASGSVIAPPDCLIASVSPSLLGNGSSNELFLTLKFPPVKRVDANVAILTSKFANNYFHWLFDTLPRLKLLDEADISYEWLIAPRQTPFQIQSLELLHIDARKILDDPALHIEASLLIVPTLPGIAGNPPQWVCAFLRETFLSDANNRQRIGRKLYISRWKNGTRKVLNESEVFALLQTDGFEFIILEDLSFTEQVSLFADASVIVSAHGAGLSNLVFCREGAVVIELFSPHYVNVVYWALANQVNLDYRYVLGEISNNRPDDDMGEHARVYKDNRKHEDISIDLSKLRASLKTV
jgi:capsular polysaccharide biosynthesis protein